MNLSDFYTPHAGQWKVHQADARYKVLVIARRWGKSRLALGELVKNWVEALKTPVPLSRVPPWHAWIVVPSEPQGRQTWNELQTLLPREFVRENGFHQDELFVELDGTGIAGAQRSWGLIEMKSAHNADSLQTAGLDFLWVNEAQDVSDAAFERMLMTIRSPGQQAQVVYEGIPSLVYDHWFRRLHTLAKEGRENYFTLPPEDCTVYSNPMLTAGELEEVENDRDVLPNAAWRRMYLAEYSELAGFFNLSKISACTSGDFLGEPLPGVDYVAGLDLGRRRDPTVLWIMDAAQRRAVFHRTWETHEDWPIQREGIIQTCRHWGLRLVKIDATGMGGDMFTQFLAEAGLPVEEYIYTEASRKGLLDSLAVAMERETVTFPNERALVRQLRNYQWVKYGRGYRPDHPAGEHDDEVQALALGLTACNPDTPARGTSGRFRPIRYLPTQEEARTGIASSVGAKMMRERHIRRLEERWHQAGIL
jgi:hypothetical protein